MTIGVFISTFQPLLKNDGSINAAGFLYFYEPGEVGSTAKVVYSDYLLTASLGSDITLDSNGRKVIYLNGDYDLVEKDSAGATIVTRSNINPDQSTSTTEPNLISNGSFETNSSNVPTGWTLFEWNTAANVVDNSATNFAHGAYSMKFVSAGSGGGTLTTNSFFAVSDSKTYTIEFLLKSTADIRNIVQFLWYDEDQVALGTPSTSVYDEATINPTSWTLIGTEATPPSGARWAKIKIIGGDSSDATSGTARFDGVKVSESKHSFIANDNSSNPGPSFELYKISASPAGGDALAQVLFYGRDSANNKQLYGKIYPIIDDPTSASEDSHITVETITAGSVVQPLGMGNGVVCGSPTGGYQGPGTINATDVYDDGVKILAPVLISTTAITTSSFQITSGIDSTYDEYELVIPDLAFATTTNYLTMTVFTSGPTEQTGANNYSYSHVDKSAIVAAGGDGSDGATNIALNNNAAGYQFSNNAARTASYVIRFFKPSGTTANKRFLWDACYETDSDTFVVVNGAGLYNGSQAAIIGIKITAGAGGNMTGTAYLYGIRKA